MSNKSTTKKVMGSITILGMFLVIIISFSALWYWAGLVQHSLRKVVEITHGSSEADQQQKIQRMRKELRDTRESRSSLHKLALSESQVPSFLNKVESLGVGDSLISVRSIDIDKESALIAVSLAFSGDFNEIVQVLENLSGITYASYIDMFEMHRNKKDILGSISQVASMRLVVPLLVDER